MSDNTNARTEFIEEVGEKELLCAGLTCDSSWGWNGSAELQYILPLGFNSDDYEAFLRSIDFNYDSGYGGQRLFGTIWYKDGTWSERGEYDGSEWWEYHMVPEIPEELKQTLEMK